MPALINFQFHLIARINDTTQVILDHIRVHDNFADALKTRLNWSKNVQDERDAPWQVILGCMNPVFCVFISLCLWLEMKLQSNPSAIASPYVFAFGNDITMPGGGQKAQDIAQSIFGRTGGAAMELAPALAMMHPPTLMPKPKSLYDLCNLWDEYLNGVGGRKPARHFSESERGRVKYKYTRRKVVWDVIRKLVDLGHSSQRAIDMIYEVYYGAQTCVTTIINRMRKDKLNGTLNPNLRG